MIKCLLSLILGISFCAHASSFKVLSLNVYGVPRPLFKNPKFNQRIDKLCEMLKDDKHEDNAGWDVILLQEVFSRKLRRKLSKCGYPYVVNINKRGRSEGFMQTGLMMLSKHKVLEQISVPYVERGDIDGFESLAERIVHRSLLLAKIQIGEKQVWFGDTHLAPNFEEVGGSSNAKARRAQMIETAQIMRSYAKGLPFVVGGDFNFGPVTPSYEPLWDEIPHFFPEVAQSLDDNTFTTYSSDNLLTTYPSDGKLDHLISSHALKAERGSLALDSKITVDGMLMNYSDHYGWQREFSFE